MEITMLGQQGCSRTVSYGGSPIGFHHYIPLRWQRDKPCSFLPRGWKTDVCIFYIYLVWCWKPDRITYLGCSSALWWVLNSKCSFNYSTPSRTFPFTACLHWLWVQPQWVRIAELGNRYNRRQLHFGVKKQVTGKGIPTTASAGMLLSMTSINHFTIEEMHQNRTNCMAGVWENGSENNVQIKCSL